MKNAVVVKAKIWESIRKELQLSHLLRREQVVSAIFSAVLMGLMTSILSISFAVLVFGKALPEALPIGIGMALVSNIILHISAAFAGSCEGIVSHVQSLPPPIQAALLSAIMATLPLSMPIENRIMVAVGAMLLTAIFTGIVLFLLGSLKLGGLIRFLPLPVVSGFLAAVGIALLVGGITTMTNISLTLPLLSKFLDMPLLFKWLPGVLLAVVLWNIVQRKKHQLVFPAILGVAIVLFYAICYAQGLTMAAMIKANLLLGPFQEGLLWHFPTTYYRQIVSLDWVAIFIHQIQIVLAIPLVCFIGGLLMLSAIEFSTGKATDPDFELKTMGISNIISGIMGGGFVGYPSATFTVMQRSLGVATRLPGMLSAFVSLIVLIAGLSFLGFIPRFVIGGLLVYFGYLFIDNAIVKQIKQSSRADLFIIAIIVLSAFWVGFIASVGVGILITTSFFVFKYSQIGVIRYIATGESLKNNLLQNETSNNDLTANLNNIVVFGLQGYIFFGTAHSLYQEIIVRVTNPTQTPLDGIIIDFSYVTGIDTSAAQSLHKLYLQLLQHDIAFIFAQMPPQVKNLLRQTVAEFDKEPNSRFAQLATLEEALAWCEEHFLEKNTNFPTVLF